MFEVNFVCTFLPCVQDVIIASLHAYPCEIMDIDKNYFQQDLALGFQKDSELAPLFNYWILKAEQSGDLSFWRNKVNFIFTCICSGS